MKKILSVFSLIALLSVATPVLAGPAGGHGNGHMGVPHGAAPRGGHYYSSARHRIPPPPVMHRHPYINVGYARRSYWRAPYYCDYRLGWCEDYYYYPAPYYRGNGVYINLGMPLH